MRLLCVAVVAAAVSPLGAADLVGFTREGNTTRLRLSQGAAELEWVTSSTFRLARCLSANCQPPRRLDRSLVDYSVADRGPGIAIRTKYLTVEVRKAGVRFEVRSNSGKELLCETTVIEGIGNAAVLEQAAAPEERYYGLGTEAADTLNLRGATISSRRPLLISSAGFGQYFPAAGQYEFDLGKTRVDRTRVTSRGTSDLEFYFYYGPSPKEILEEHRAITGPIQSMSPRELEVLSVETLPGDAERLPAPKAQSWEALRETVRSLNRASFTGVLVPAFDLAAFPDSGAVARRAAQLGALLPMVYCPEGAAWEQARRSLTKERARWTPYLLTYLQEAKDRGLPVIHPLAMQFPADAEAARHQDAFLVGDEMLVAPVLGEEARRAVYLPMGTWTEMRTNTRHAGRQVVVVQGDAGSVPVLIRNGSIVPMGAFEDPLPMQLHYFPRLGGEFFLYEQAGGHWTQFHASPAGEFLRLEIEARARRSYEWIAHHIPAVVEVEGDGQAYEEVKEPEMLRHGSWYYDKARRNLHVRVDAEMDSDMIVNVRLPGELPPDGAGVR